MLKAFLKDESGATAIEYGLICALMFLAIVSAVYAFAGNSNAMFNKISTSIAAATA